MNQYVIKNCPCFDDENEKNCIAEDKTLSRYCQDNANCPIRKTYEVLQGSDYFGVEYLDTWSPEYDIHINSLIDIAKEEK